MASAGRVTVISPPSLSPAVISGGIRRLIEHRGLLRELSVHRIRVRYKQSALGVTWAVAQPLALMAVYTVIFSVVTRVPTSGIPYPIFVFAALLPWTFFSGTVSSGATSLVTHQQWITKVSFPREILPITYLVVGLFDFVIGLLILGFFLIRYDTSLSWQALWSVPLIAVAAVFSLGMSFFLCTVQVRFRDVGLAMPLVMQLWMFASPVVYPYNAVPERFRPLYSLNPMAGVVENFRRVVLERLPPEADLLWKAAVISCAVFAGGYLYLKYREALLADII